VRRAHGFAAAVVPTMRVRGLKNSMVTASLGEKERMPNICIFSIVVDMVAIDGEDNGMWRH